VAGLTVLGTVLAQQPSGGGYIQNTGGYQPSSGYTPTKVTPAGGTLPTTPVVRPYADWTPTPGSVPSGGSYLPPPGGSGVQPVNYQPGGTTYPPVNKPRLTAPAVAGGTGVGPAGGVIVPPPSMDVNVPPAERTTAVPLPPPSVSLEGNDKFPPLPVPPAPSGVIPPPAFPGPESIPPLPAPPVPTPKPFPVPPAPVVPSAPPTVPSAVPGALPVTPGATSGILPGKVNQQVTVEAVCPDSVVYNTEFRYELVVHNTGNVAVQNVRVEDEIPAGVRYVGSDPAGELNGDKLVWSIGALDGNASKRIAIRVRPTEEGEIRSRAVVSFTSTVEARTKVTRPRVAVVMSAPEVARAGDEAVFRIKVTNSGTGPAQNMVLKAYLSDGLNYKNQGNELVSKLATLPAGESKNVDLPLSTAKAGSQWCQITVTAEGSQDATAKAAVNVVEPQLQITQTGPAKCLVRGEPTYEITLSNPGTAATDALTVQTILPDGFDFVQASDSGAFNATYRSVTWKLSGLPAGGTKSVGVKLRAAAAGDVSLRTTAQSVPEAPVAPAGVGAKPAGRVLEAKADTAIKSEGIAAVRFDVKGLVNPVEVGKDAEYEIRVTNQGTGACTNVQLMAAMADNCTFSGASGGPDGKGGNAKAQGQTLVFDPIATLPVKGEVVYTVRVKSTATGNQKFRVQLTCDQVREPDVKVESTNFYKQ
jgi:uncharacterized repeat protein (TIGR01451 family)